MKEAKYVEIRELINRDSFRAVLRIELPDSANLRTARSILAIKSDEGKEERYKAKYVADEKLDSMKDYLVRGAQPIQYVLVRIILIVAKVKVLRIWLADI